MKKKLLALAFTALFFLPAAGGAQEKKKLTATVPVDGIGYLEVKIDRDAIKGAVIISIVELPAGIKLVDKAKVQTLKTDNDNEVTFKLWAGKDLDPQKVYKAKVRVKTETGESLKEVDIIVRDFNLHGTSWIIMFISVTAVIILVSFCVYRVLTLPPVEMEETLKGPLEIDTRDTEDAD